MPIPNAAAATWAAQAEPDSLDFAVIQAGMASTGVLSGCACTPGNSGVNLSVTVAAGSVYVGSKTSASVAGGTVTPGAAHASNPRFDLVVADGAGALSVVAGTAAAAPAFPSPPASRVVLCAVYIPATATSITASNIVDKRQMVDYAPGAGTVTAGKIATGGVSAGAQVANAILTDAHFAAANIDGVAATASLRTLGTGAQMAAAGNHTHAGTYASTLHAATHAPGGSDPLTWSTVLTDGTGYFTFTPQTTRIATPDGSPNLRLHSLVLANRPVMGVGASYSLEALDALFGPASRWAVFPSATTALNTILGPAVTIAATLSHPQPTQAYGIHGNFQVTAAGQTGMQSPHLGWCRGSDHDSPWLGAWMAIRVCFPDASYTNSGASTGVRFFFGFTDQSSTTTTGADNPTGTRFGIQYVNVNGGKTQTTFQMTARDASGTENLTNTTVGITQNKWYDFFIHMHNWGACYVQIDDVLARTVLYSGSTTTGIPAESTFMRAAAHMTSVNATTRNWKFQRLVVDAGSDWV